MGGHSVVVVVVAVADKVVSPGLHITDFSLETFGKSPKSFLGILGDGCLETRNPKPERKTLSKTNDSLELVIVAVSKL